MNLAEYHALDAIGNGRISDFIRGPDIYNGRYNLAPTDPGYIPDTDSPMSRMGSAFHALVLEGMEAYESRYAIWRGGFCKAAKKGEEPKPTMSTNSDAYRDFEAAATLVGQAVLSKGDHETIQECAAALYEHEDARELLQAAGNTEVTVLFEQLGMPCKARFDKRIDTAHIGLDLKLTELPDLDAFQKHAVKAGLHRQAEWYRRAYFADTGHPLRDFLFVVQRASRPRRTWVWRCDAELEAVARIEIDLALRDILGRKQTNDWTPDECRHVHTLGIKPWQISPQVAAEMERRA